MRRGFGKTALSYQLSALVVAGRADSISARGMELKAKGCGLRADVAQLVEHSLGKGEVTSSILVISSRRTVVSGQLSVHAVDGWAIETSIGNGKLRAVC